MNSLYKFFDHPVGRFLIIGTFSVAAAYLFWQIGGSFAKIISPKSSVGVSFELGRRDCWICLRLFDTSNSVLSKLYSQSYTRLVRAFLAPREWFATNAGYSCKLSIYDRESGNERIFNVVPHRENGYPTVDIRELGARESFVIELSNAKRR